VYCLCVNVYCHRVTAQLQLINILLYIIIFCICQINEKQWEHNVAVHQLFVDFKKAYNSVSLEVLYNTLIEFGIPMKIVTTTTTTIIGTTAHSEPRSSSETSAHLPYFSRHSSNIFLPTSWHHNTFHEPILRSLIRFAGRRILDSPAFAIFRFRKILFSGAGCPTPSNPGGPIALLLSLDLHHGPVWHGKM
jgi:hypothetical protein